MTEQTDPEAETQQPSGGLISAIQPGSVGAEIGLEPGDRLLAINGHPLRDLIDYRYYGAEEELVLEVRREGEIHRLEVERDYDEDLGIEFAEITFDGMRQCDNRCPFCFVRQMPRGMRRSLYLRDDDYRYSFLLGNFITLTNLTEEDWQRIGEQRLSPLYISIHATDSTVRQIILGNPDAPDIMPQLERLRDMGIQLHGQIVIAPGINDGDALQRSIDDLMPLWPTLQTLALVPVGLTRYHRGGVRLMRPDEAQSVLQLAEERIPGLRQRTGRTWLYPSDEMYLLAGKDVPEADFYDEEGAQMENGVGLVRLLLDDWEEYREWAAEIGEQAGRPESISLVCGTLIAPILREMAAEMEVLAGMTVRVVPVENRLMGESVTVSGLLAGADVLDALAQVDPGEQVFVPHAMFESEGIYTLDNLTVDEMAERLGVPVTPVSTMSDVLEALDKGD
jgi:putative radical SAM enzyme (TIGR03279 family)